MKYVSALFVLLLALSTALANAATPVVAEDAKPYLLEKEPEKAQDVKTVRNKSKDGEDITVVGRIGGRRDPWVKGAAAFSIVDASLKSCDQIPGDNCPTPWDYCCETDLAKATVLVTVVNEGGAMVKKDARELLGLKELQTVVVQGKAKRDAAGNVRVLASKVFVRPEQTVAK